MNSRFDFIKDPAERRRLVMLQVVALVAYLFVIAAIVVFNRMDRPAESDSAQARPAPAAVSPLESRPIGRGEGA